MKRLLDLARLAVGMPGITSAVGSVMAEAGSVCLEGEGHAEAAPLQVDGDFHAEFVLQRLEVSEQMRRAHQFETTATERGACGVAALLIGELTPYTILEEAKKGSYFDYWLGLPGGFLFQGAARLEVSGIRRADESTVRDRCKVKSEQIDRSPEPIPGFVVVVEFSRPLASWEPWSWQHRIPEILAAYLGKMDHLLA